MTDADRVPARSSDRGDTKLATGGRFKGTIIGESMSAMGSVEDVRCFCAAARWVREPTDLEFGRTGSTAPNPIAASVIAGYNPCPYTSYSFPAIRTRYQWLLSVWDLCLDPTPYGSCNHPFQYSVLTVK